MVSRLLNLLCEFPEINFPFECTRLESFLTRVTTMYIDYRILPVIVETVVETNVNQAMDFFQRWYQFV